MSDIKEKSNSKKDILKTARDCFQQAVEAEAERRLEALDDLKFRAGDHWPQELLNQRKIENRPSLTINKIPQFIRQVTNDQRQNRPQIKVHPVDDKADVEVAKILQGIIKHIEYNSNAEIAIDTAFEGAVTNSFGYYRIITDYVNETSFNQEIKYKKIDNPFSVYFDPNSIEPDGSDAEWAQIILSMSRDEFKRAYPKAECNDMESWSSTGDSEEWINKDTIRVAEYFYKEYEKTNVYLLESGESVFESDLQDGMIPIDKRETYKCTIKWIKHNGYEILEETTWLGKYIPIVPVYGDRLNINGKIILESLVRHTKDSSRMYDYYVSSEAEAIALAPKAPFVIAEGQVEGYKKQWAQANRTSQAYLPYKAVSVDGTLVGAPQRQQFEPAVQAITNGRMQASEDLKAVTGIYDASLGARSNEVSGVAIRGRQQQAQTSNFHFIDNLTRSIRHTGRILIDLIPKVYDTAQAIRILGEDGNYEIVRINEMFNRDGKPVWYNLDVGLYDVVVETGPSYATRRQETAQFMIDFIKTVPQQAAILSDLVLKNMDVQGASEMAERIKKTLPPNILDDGKNQQIPPQVQQQMQLLAQQNQQLQAQLGQAMQAIQTKSLELQSKEKIEIEKLKSDARIKAAELELEYVKLEKELAPDSALQNVISEIAKINAQQSQYENFNGFVPQWNATQINQPLTDEQQTSGQITGV